MNYSDINTPSELLEYMKDNIHYGFVDDEGKKHGPWNNEEFQNTCRISWHLSSPLRLLKVKYGHCFDQVELERYWFKKHGYNFKTFFIMFLLPYDNAYSTHTYLVYEENGKYYYFEHSDYNNLGIYEFMSLEDAINYQKKKHIENNQKTNDINDEVLKKIKVFEYDEPLYNISMSDFIDYILENGKEVNITNKNY